ncbi:MAG: 50S ribosomal protein L4 [Candidatus Diapherotrites archaeon]|nr:50S ribosomal protein L4 [Candidatus Diapherotrites archaeon]
MKAPVLSIDGKKIKDITLPEVFSEEYHPTLIRRAVVALQSRRFQPHAPYKYAGLETSATYVGRRGAFRAGINRGISRLPRVKLPGGGLGEVRKVPHAKGGRRAHPPKVEKIVEKKINKKEKIKATRSAIAATAKKEIVEKRGHKIDSVKHLPIIVEDKFQELSKTKDVVSVLEKIGLKDEIERAKVRKERAGKQKRRGKRLRKKKSALIIVLDGSKVRRACKNIPGIDVTTPNRLNVELLAPGTHAGRLTIWTESAVKKIGEKYGS